MTPLFVDSRSNHRESTKRGVIKGYADRARTLCDPEYLQKEMENIEEVFVENGYSKTEVRRAMREREEHTENEDEEEKEIRGIVSIPNIPSITRTYSRIASKHNFQTTTRAENKIKDLA